MTHQTKHAPESTHAEPVAHEDRAQLFGVIGGPLALLAGLQGKYLVAQLWGCGSLTANMINHVIAFAALAIAIVAALVSRAQWRGAGVEVPGDHDGSDGRTRTIAAVGFGMSLLSALVIVSQWLPQFVLDPCLE